MKTVMKVSNLCKTYVVNKRQNHVLKNVNFTMNEGDFVAIMGPSGSGKSTLLYSVSGMDHMTAGDVCFLGQNLASLSDNQMSEVRLNSMGFVFQQMHMLKSLSIFDNIVVAAYHSQEGKTHAGRKAINERATVLMNKMNISDIADNDISEVSGGQLQRVCICRALINNPGVLFADEPTGALNSQASKEVMQEMIRINQEGTTIMLVTHDVKVAAKSDKVLYIEDGNIRGELPMGKCQSGDNMREREMKLNSWLLEMGW